MATFAALGKLTDEGLKNMDAIGPRHQKAKERAEEHGVTIVGSYALMGLYDFLVILEAPDAETAVRVLTKESEHGNVRYNTMQAFSIESFAESLEE
jgi:uncharacterized protein with GYD domain